VTLFYGLL